jgi:Fur family ferric uptake transcriptional regulator
MQLQLHLHRHRSGAADLVQTTRLPMSKDLPAIQSLGDLQARIRQAGLRSTAARIAVLRELVDARTPVSHAELATKLVPQGFDKATVYRNLMDLSEVGMVSRTELGDHVWRFELRREEGGHNNDHPHFLCTDCGMVTCLSDVSVNLAAMLASKQSTGMTVTEVLLKGRCGTCTPAESPALPVVSL